jgi:oligopeptide/dipeptide ABC transporter ATP-binding protein
LLSSPAHPYTRELVAAAPRFEEAPLSEPAPPPFPDATAGCPYAPRCRLAQARCLEEAPDLTPREDGRRAACHMA